MKSARLFHNPSAGDEEHAKEELIALVEAKGYTCSYTSVKEPDWEIGEKTDLIIIAGGDGTVRKVVEKLITGEADSTAPIALLPIGTANNIASSLGYAVDKPYTFDLSDKKIKRLDIGRISGADSNFFLEGFGSGLFPTLMQQMKNNKPEGASPAEELKIALRKIIEITDTYQADECILEIDGNKYSGRFLLVEVLNIRCIGPNMDLAPSADPADGYFDVVIVEENRRNDFKQYISNILANSGEYLSFTRIRGKKINLLKAGNLAHADDQLLDIEKKQIGIEMQESVLSFFVAE